VGVAPLKQIAEGARVAPHATTTPQRSSPPWNAVEEERRNEVEGSAAASGMRRHDESDEGAVTAGAADGRLQHTEVQRRRRPARCGEERAAEEGPADAERPPNHLRASDGAMPAGAHLLRPATAALRPHQQAA